MADNDGTWRVTGQAQTTQVDPQTSNFVEGLLVNFVTGAGHAGSVFLPMTAATPENVRAAIVARVAIMDGIASLSSEGG